MNLLQRAVSRVRRVRKSVPIRRRFHVFGQDLTFTAESVFPDYRRHRLPERSPKQRIVQYGDFVQMHAVVDYVGGLSNNPLIVDVGAHHGAYACVLGKMVAGRGTVLAIEPEPAAFRILTENVRLNGLRDTVRCVQCAVSDREGSIGIHSQGSESFMAPGGATVPMRTMAGLLRDAGAAAVDLLMVDVEGAELPVLRGYPWASVPAGRIFCELHPNEWPKFGYGEAEFGEFLRQRALRCVDTYLREWTPGGGASGRGHVGPCLLLP